jgi:pimeloyl-ACP methyl ester carboxylesterase
MVIDESTLLSTSAGAEITRGVVEVKGRRISYLSAGGPAGGQTILLIHGSGVSARYWVNQLRGLGGAVRVLAIDLPGHGESDPTDAASIEAYSDAVTGALDALGTGPVIAAGHSLGGAIVIALAARRPDAVTGLVLLSACVKIPHTDGSGERWLAALPGPLRKIVFFSMAKKLLFGAGAPAQAVSLGMQELRTCRPETILKDVAAAKAMDLTEQAARLDLPTLILCGSRDRLTPPALSERLGELIAGARLRIIEGAGHMLLLEVPERVNQEVLEFAGAAVARPDAARAAQRRRGRSLLRRLLDWVRERAP